MKPLPDLPRLFRVIDATWPAARRDRVGPWMIRTGAGGGNRVSAATAEGAVGPGDLPQAETAMRAVGQRPQIMVRTGEDTLDRMLADHGYLRRDDSVVYAAQVDDLQGNVPPVTAFTAWPPLAAQVDIWEAGGIGPARIAVMDRGASPKVTFLGRLNDRPAGTVYAGISEGCAMIHALEIGADHRRQGLARVLTHAVARWAKDQGATWLTLVTTEANAGANALYQSLGMTRMGGYHYRIKENADD